MRLGSVFARRVAGHKDFGFNRIPPRPHFFILTDRADGTEWLLSHDATGEYIAISDDPPSIFPGSNKEWADVRRYVAYDGPLVGETNYRLLVRGGYLGYEPVQDGIVAQARVLTRRLGERILLEIIVPASWRGYNDNIGYETEPL